MRCQWRDCQSEAAECVVLDLTRPSKHLCTEHAEHVGGTLRTTRLLPRLYWPKAGSRNTSRRWTHGQDWKPLV